MPQETTTVKEISITRGPRCFYVSWLDGGAGQEREFSTFGEARTFSRALASLRRAFQEGNDGE